MLARRYAIFFVSLFCTFSSISLGGERIKVPIRWCGVEGAPSMVNPGVVVDGGGNPEVTTDNVLWRRHERPTDKIYIPMVDMQFRAGATAAIKNGPQSFPIIRDPQGSGGNILYDTGEASDAANLCMRAWQMGDPLYFDQNNNGVVNDGSETLLSTDSPIVGDIEIGHDGAPLQPAPSDVRFVDHLTTNGQFDIGERIYRDENEDGFVDVGDTLLTSTEGTVVGNINPGDVTAPLLPVPDQIKYVDLIRQPPNTFNIGYPAVQGIISVSANDFEVNRIGFPVHGVAIGGIGGNSVVMDDPSQYLPPGPDFKLFETQLVGHEFGHAMGLQHGDGIDDDMDGNLDDGDDPAAPIPDAGSGTLCDQDNVMQYCWLDNGSSGFPNLEWIGVGDPSFGVFTHDLPDLDQKDVLRNHALTNIPDREVDPVTPPLESTRTDVIGDVPFPFEYIDIADFSVVVDASRTNTKFSLKTRRPFPEDIVPIPAAAGIDTEEIDRLNFHFILDIDGNPLSGGSPADISIPTDFGGAEYVITVNLEGGRVQAVTLFKHNSATSLFAPVTGANIRAVRETIEAIVDFPGSLRDGDPDNFTGALIDLAVGEEITAIVPNGILEEPFGSRFRVEYISHAVQDDVLDRARTQGMNFDLPVFPDCTTDPGGVRTSEMTKVNATGLLPNRDVEVFLGDMEVGKGTSDSDGNATVKFTIPSDSTSGDRLVTVGAFAVTADCSVEVLDNGEPPIPSACDPSTPGAIIGTAGDDRLIGTSDDDVIIGLEGNDTIAGRGGNDCIAGGPGNDTITSRDGDDEIDGGIGNDRINAGNGANTIIGGEGNDNIISGRGNDAINGGAGDDNIKSGRGDDEIDGGSGNDRIIGGPGTDICVNGEVIASCNP